MRGVYLNELTYKISRSCTLAIFNATNHLSPHGLPDLPHPQKRQGGERMVGMTAALTFEKMLTMLEMSSKMGRRVLLG